MSDNAIPAQGTTLHIAGTAGGAKTITGVQVGFPTIITIAAHGFSNGDYPAFAGLTGADAALINGQSFSIHSKTTNTFAINVDTTGKTITAAGTATPLAWIKVGELKGIKASGSTASEFPTTDLDSTAVQTRLGLGDPGTITLDNFCVDTDAGLAAMLAAHTAIPKPLKTFKITYPVGATPVRTFQASVKKFPDIGDASIDGSISGTIELRRSGGATVS